MLNRKSTLMKCVFQYGRLQFNFSVNLTPTILLLSLVVLNLSARKWKPHSESHHSPEGGSPLLKDTSYISLQDHSQNFHWQMKKGSLHRMFSTCVQRISLMEKARKKQIQKIIQKVLKRNTLESLISEDRNKIRNEEIFINTARNYFQASIHYTFPLQILKY